MKIVTKNRQCEIFDIFPNENVWLRENFTYSNEYSLEPEEAIWDSDKFQGYYAPVGMALIIEERAKGLSDIIVEIIDPSKSLEVDLDVDILKYVHKNIFEQIELRDYQVTAVRKAVSFKEGMIESPTGSGKTEMIFAILDILFRYGRITSALLVAPDIFLTKQLLERAMIRGFSREDIGIIQGENHDTSKKITIATIDSLSNRFHNGMEDVLELMKTVDLAIWDECHHLQSYSNRTMLFAVEKAKYIFGFSASPFSSSSPEGISDMVLLALVKRVIFKLDQAYLTNKGYIARPIIHFHYIGGQLKYRNVPYNKLYKSNVVEHRPRNLSIVKYAKLFKKYGLPCLILVTQKAHGISLLKMIDMPDCVAMFGGSEQLVYEHGAVVSRTCDFESFKVNFETGIINTVIATQVFDEGVDLTKIGAYINAGAGKSYKKTKQRVGRGLRKKEGMNLLFVVDFCDRTHVILYNQYKERKETYLEIGGRIYADEYEYIRLIHNNWESINGDR